MPKQPDVADHAARVELDASELIAKAFRDYWRYRLTLPDATLGPAQQDRDVIAGGKVVAVLPVDLARDEVVLIRQFRVAAHLALGQGDMVEIVAGLVERGEDVATAARRECAEEIGVAPDKLVELFSFMTTPGMTDETITLFVASIDATRVPAHSGAPDEGEQIATIRVSIDDALAALGTHKVHNGPLILALQWLALNRARLDELLTHS